MLGSTATTLADSTANSAVVAAICVDQSQHSASTANNLSFGSARARWLSLRATHDDAITRFRPGGYRAQAACPCGRVSRARW